MDCTCSSSCTVHPCVCAIHMLLDTRTGVLIGQCALNDLCHFSSVIYSLVSCSECISSSTSIHCTPCKGTFWCDKLARDVLYCSRCYIFATLMRGKTSSSIKSGWTSAMPFNWEACFPRVLYWCATCTQSLISCPLQDVEGGFQLYVVLVMVVLSRVCHWCWGSLEQFTSSGLVWLS